jgi:hypothetical protein
MSANPEVERIVTLPALPAQTVVEGPVVAAAPAPEAPVVDVQPAAADAAPRRRRTWIAPAAIAVVGVIASGSLGYFLYVTAQQRDSLHSRLVTTQGQLSAAQADAANKKVTATYVAMYVADEGKVQTDYQTIVVCSDYSTCRTAAQQLLMDMQAFQADRKTANVPSNLMSTDSTAGDALSAAIAGDQEFIVGLDNGDEAKAKEGGAKVDAAMLSLDKAQVTLGSQLK